MNRDIFEGRWKQLAGRVKALWGALTGDEVRRIRGRFEELSGLVQVRYGRHRERMDKEVRDLIDRL